MFDKDIQKSYLMKSRRSNTSERLRQGSTFTSLSLSCQDVRGKYSYVKGSIVYSSFGAASKNNHNQLLVSKCKLNQRQLDLV